MIICLKTLFYIYRYNTRHIALKIAYLGWDYNGFVVQEDTDKTIESALFEALLKTRLIESRYGNKKKTFIKFSYIYIFLIFCMYCIDIECNKQL